MIEDEDAGEDGWDSKPVYSDGLMHVMAEQCSTCIGRPGNLMHLMPGRVRGMVRDSIAADSCIPCHQSLPTDQQGICRWFFDTYGDRVFLIRLAQALPHMIEEVPLAEEPH